MPAAAVIPAPKVYLNVVAVKKLVVELLAFPQALLGLYGGVIRLESHSVGNLVWRNRHFTLKKLECSRQAFA